MSGAGTWEAGISVPVVRRDEPAGRRGAASRRRSLALLLVFASGASAAGAAMGLLKQPDPDGRADDLAFTAAAAVEAARTAMERARRAEQELAAAKARIGALSALGAEEELADYQEAERLGVSRFMKDSLWGGERRRVMATIVRESRRNGLDPALVAAVVVAATRRRLLRRPAGRFVRSAQPVAASAPSIRSQRQVHCSETALYRNDA